MKYTTLSKLLEGIIDYSEIKTSAEQVNNKIKITWHIPTETGASDDYIDIVHCFKFDMDSLLSIIASKGFYISKETILRIMELTYDNLLPSIMNNDYHALADLVIKNRGAGVSKTLGII